MARRESVQQFGTDFAKALAGVMFKMKQKRFEEDLDRQMQPKEETTQEQQGTKFQSVPNAGVPYSPEVIASGGMNVPNMVSKTTTTTPNIMQVLSGLARQYPEQVNQQAQSLNNLAIAGKQPWMSTAKGGLETNVLTGAQISNPDTQTGRLQQDVKVGDVTTPENDKIVTYMRPDKTIYKVNLGKERATSNQSQSQKLESTDIELLAKQAIKYQLDPNQLSRFNKDLVFAKAMQLDPKFDTKQYPQRRKLQDEFFGQGATAARMAQMNALVSHTGDMYDASKALKNSDYPLINKAINLGIQQTGDPRVDAFLFPAMAAMTEMASLLKSGVGRASATEQEIGTWQKMMTNAKSPEQFKTIANSMAHLMGGQTAAIQKRWKSGMGTNETISIFSNRTKEVLNQFGVDPSFIEGGMEAKQPSAQSNTPKIGQIEDGHRFKGGDPSKQENWEEVK
jgi:hypothetical protein